MGGAGGEYLGPNAFRLDGPIAECRECVRGLLPCPNHRPLRPDVRIESGTGNPDTDRRRQL